jgi:CRP/FNR family transcriptional regulator
MSLKALLKDADLFSTLDDKELDLLISISTINNYQKDYIVHYEKEQSNKLLFLITGFAKAYKIDKHKNEIFLYYIYKNTLISDIQKDRIISFSNVALLEDSQVLSIDYHSFKKHFLDKGMLCNEFTNEILSKSQQLQSLVNREFVFNSVAKVAMMLDKDLDIFNKLKRAEISLMLHIQPETLSRVLNRLKRDSIIGIKNTKVEILNNLALKSVYEDL